MSDFLDVVRERAAKKKGYDPRLVGGAPRLRPVPSPVFRPAPSPRPSVGGYSSRMSPGVPTPDPARLARLNAAMRASRQDDGFGLGDAGSWALKGFSGLIDLADTPGAFVRSGIKELILDNLPRGILNEGAPESDGMSWSDFVRQGKGDSWFDTEGFGSGNIRFSDLSESIGAFDDDSGLGKYGNALVNFVGDVASDPLLYGAGSTVRQGAAQGAGALDAALASGARRGLAEEVTEQAAQRGLLKAGSESADEVRKLAADAGLRGRSAFTSKGLQRSGVRPELLEQLGLTSKFGLSYGYGHGGRGARVAIPGTRRVAEGAENLKGAFKMNVSGTKVARAGRNLFVGSDDAIGQAERQFVDRLVTGASNAGEAAQGLVAIRRAKREAYPWFDELNEQAVKRFGDKFNKLSPEKRAEIAYKAEIGDFGDEMAKDVADWYKTVGEGLQTDGVEFGWIDNYVNHRMTDRFRKDVILGRNQKIAAQGLDAAAPFQNTRTLRIDEEFLGHSIDDAATKAVDGQEYWTIKQLNEISKQELGYKAFEDDITQLMGAYMEQALKAKMRREVYRSTDELGLNQLKTVQDSTRKSIEDDIKAATDMLATSARKRRQALTRAARTIGARREAVSAELEEVEGRIRDRLTRMDELAERRNVLSKELKDKEEQIAVWRSTVEDATGKAKRSRSKSKGDLTKKIAKMEQEADEIRSKLQGTLASMSRIEAAGGTSAQLQAQARALKDEYQSLSRQQLEAEAARKALDDPGLPVPRDPDSVAADDVVGDAVQNLNKVAQVRDEFTSVSDEYFDASASIIWQTTDDAAKRQRIEMRLDNIDEATKGLPEGFSDDVGELANKGNVMVQALQDEGLDATARAVRDAEAQALAWDMSAGAKLMTAAEAKKNFLDSLTNPKYQEYMQTVLGDGFTVIDNQIAVPKWFDQAFQSIPKSQNEWGRMRRLIGLYDSGMNVWKGYATASPGFVWRNMYSGFYNMYLDNVSASSVKRFQRFIHDYHNPTKLRQKIAGRDHGLEYAKERAAQRWGWDIDGPEIKQMEDALNAASVSGWGLTPQEVEANLLDGTTLKPWKPDFKPTSAVRGWSTNVEGLLRGSHAYDVIRKGGSIDEAVRRVEKFHFNYRDISEFDRMMKRAIPFWTFYSRNMALQAEMWARYPQKVNRSYFNLKRNLEAQSDPDDVVPGYFSELGAIRTPFGQRNGGTVYLTPDLPTLRFQNDLAQITQAGGEGSGPDPLRMLSDFGPAFKVPIEMLQNRELFTGIDFKNDLSEFDPDTGGRVGRDAGLLFQLPGIKQAADVAFGDNAEIVNGRLLMQDNVESAIEDFLPIVGRMNRLVPMNEKQQERLGQNWASFFGLPGRVNTENSIRGELFGRQIDAQRRADQERYRQLLEQITG